VNGPVSAIPLPSSSGSRVSTQHVSSEARRHWIAVGVALLYVTFISSAFVAIKVTVKYCPPFTLLAVRYLTAGAFMVALVKLVGDPWPTRRNWARIGLLGVIQWLLPAAINFVALRHASAGVAAIMYATNPLMMAAFGSRMLGERLTPTRIFGLLLGFGGVVAVMFSRVGAGRADTPLGVFLLFLAVLGMVFGTLLFKRFPVRDSLFVVNAVQALVSGVLLVPVAFLFERPSDAQLNLPLLAATLHLVVLVTIAAPLMWYWLLRRGEVSTASSYLFLTPLFGVAFAALLLHERFGVRDAAGFVAATLGIILIRRG
jgi:drug/metabolite transporter (DMT)-like permease